MDTIPDFCCSPGPNAWPLDCYTKDTISVWKMACTQDWSPRWVSMLPVARDPWDKLLPRGLRDLASLMFRHGMDPGSIYQKRNGATGWQAALSSPWMIKGFLRQGNCAVWRSFKTTWRKTAGWSCRSLLKPQPGYGLKQFLSLDYP